MLLHRLLAAMTLVALAVPACIAGLKWETPEVLLDLDSSMAGGDAVFSFVNEGTTPVKILNIKPGCGCTVPVLEKTEFAPGEHGTLSTRFTTGERRGAYHVPIHVQMDDGSLAELSLVAQIRELVKYFPPNIAWAKGEKRAPKDIEFHWSASDDVKITALRSVNPSIKVELVADHDWNGARVRLTPTGDEVTGTSVVVITTAQGSERRVRTYTVVARAM
jgi:hypothetical protein